MTSHFLSTDLREIEQFAYRLRNRFMNDFGASNAPADVEQLLDLADRAQMELDSKPAALTSADAELLDRTRRNVMSGVPSDLDSLTADARVDVDYRRSVGTSLSRVLTVVNERLQRPASATAQPN